jgi:hypothetical protein
MQPKEIVKGLAKDLPENLQAHARQSVLEPMKNDGIDWTQEARQLCRKWALRYTKAIHFSLLKKDCFRKGTRNIVSDVSWNAELSMLQEAAVQRHFMNLLLALHMKQNGFQAEIETLLDKTRRTIRGNV